MANTRKLSTTSLLIVAHGETRGSKDNWLPLAIANRLRLTEKFAEVEIGLLNGDPSLESAALKLTKSHVIILPLFMCHGYFIRTSIPKRLGLSTDYLDGEGRKFDILPPIGLAENFPMFLVNSAIDTASSNSVKINEATFLLAAHGSKKSSHSAEATNQIVEKAKKLGPFARVIAGYLEEAPFLPDVLRESTGPILLSGLFAGQGLHGCEDMKRAIAECDRNDVFVTQSLGRDPSFVELISDNTLSQL